MRKHLGVFIIIISSLMIFVACSDKSNHDEQANKENNTEKAVVKEDSKDSPIKVADKQDTEDKVKKGDKANKVKKKEVKLSSKKQVEPKKETVAKQEVVSKPVKSTKQKTTKSKSADQITHKYETKEQAIKYKTVKQNDNSRKKSAAPVVKQAGKNGVTRTTIKVTYVNGKETDRSKVKSETTTKPVDEIILIGTKKEVASDMRFNNAYEQEVIRLTNAERKQAGLSELKEDKVVSQLAREHSIYLIEHNLREHSDLNKLLRDAGVSYRWGGENVAGGHADPETVVSRWMASPGHEANILNSSYTHIGVGYAIGPDGDPHWTQMFYVK